MIPLAILFGLGLAIGCVLGLQVGHDRGFTAGKRFVLGLVSSFEGAEIFAQLLAREGVHMVHPDELKTFLTERRQRS